MSAYIPEQPSSRTAIQITSALCPARAAELAGNTGQASRYCQGVQAAADRQGNRLRRKATWR